MSSGWKQFSWLKILCLVTPSTHLASSLRGLCGLLRENTWDWWSYVVFASCRLKEGEFKGMNKLLVQPIVDLTCWTISTQNLFYVKRWCKPLWVVALKYVREKNTHTHTSIQIHNVCVNEITTSKWITLEKTKWASVSVQLQAKKGMFSKNAKEFTAVSIRSAHETPISVPPHCFSPKTAELLWSNGCHLSGWGSATEPQHAGWMPWPDTT